MPKNHPLWSILTWLNEAFNRMDVLFTRMYESDAEGGRPSIALEKLIRTLLFHAQ